eukprot:5442737-Pyramimonas_sp.AAC.1
MAHAIPPTPRRSGRLQWLAPFRRPAEGATAWLPHIFPRSWPKRVQERGNMCGRLQYDSQELPR